MSGKPAPIIGIDLGTTNSVCTYYDFEDNIPKIVPIEQPWQGWEKHNFKQSEQLSCHNMRQGNLAWHNRFTGQSLG